MAKISTKSPRPESDCRRGRAEEIADVVRALFGVCGWGWLGTLGGYLRHCRYLVAQQPSTHSPLPRGNFRGTPASVRAEDFIRSTQILSSLSPASPVLPVHFAYPSCAETLHHGPRHTSNRQATRSIDCLCHCRFSSCSPVLSLPTPILNASPDSGAKKEQTADTHSQKHIPSPAGR